MAHILFCDNDIEVFDQQGSHQFWRYPAIRGYTASVMSGTGEPLSYSQKKRGRRLFYLFALFNSFSFLLLSGNIITLYLIRLGASTTIIGVASAFAYISFFFMLLGKIWARSVGVVKTFGLGWLLRYITMLPILLTPFFLGVDTAPAIILAMVGIAGFNVFRGVGIVGQSPVVAALSAGRDRGTFLTGFSIIAQASSILISIAVALFVGPEAPTMRYIVFIAVGLGLGFLSTALVFRLPEPAEAKDSARIALTTGVREVLSDRNTRRFLLSFGIYSFVVGMIRPFLIVYVKQVYGFSDTAALLFTVVASLGAILMGVIAQVVMDRLGAKPLILIFASVFLLSLVAVAAIPELSPPLLFFFLGAVFFVSAFGSTGGENAAQAYFYSLVRADAAVNMGIVYFLTLAVGGTLGSPVAGLLIDALNASGRFSPPDVFRIFFAAGGVLTILAILLVTRIHRLGSVSVRSALSVIFNVRDLRAINLVQRLDRTASIGEERTVLRRLRRTGSGVSVDDVISRLNSPSYLIRAEALATLQTMPVTPAMRRALISVVRTQPFTTAHVAARMIGDRRIGEGRSVLRESLRSEDYVLAAESILSLAKLEDRGAIPEIELLLNVSTNPRLLLLGVVGLKLFASTGSVPVLLRLLAAHDTQAYLADETVLALAGIAEIEDWFFPFYRRFLVDREEALDQLEGEIDKVATRQGAAATNSPLGELPRRLLAGSDEALRLLGVLLEERVKPARPAKLVDALRTSLSTRALVSQGRYLFFCVALVVAVELERGIRSGGG